MSGDEVIENDLVIIGAGLYGIQAARTYLDVHPRCDVTILEASLSVGGVWSSERMYDAFWTQTPLDIAEFSDQPLGEVPAVDQYYRFFSARHITRYLEEYVDSHVYNGTSLRSRIRFNCTVESLVKEDKSWVVKVRDQSFACKTPRIIDASGLTSTPIIPEIPGTESFKGTLIHHKQFGQSDILCNRHINNVVVVGGAKSAADVAYAAAKAGKIVSWIIRKSGSGPGAFLNAKGRGNYRNSNESFYTRFTGYFISSIFPSYPWWIRWLYNTSIGQRVFNRIWNSINDSCLKFADYEREDGRIHGFHNLKPDTKVFWQNDSSSINQREDFFDTIVNNVSVYRDDIVSLTDQQEVKVAAGIGIKADAVIFATGWSNQHSYLTTRLKAVLGLPVPTTELESTELELWEQLDQEADVSVLRQFPVLAKVPPVHKFALIGSNAYSYTPYRLYNAMVPLKDQSILFLGHIMLGNHFRASEVQALWAVALFDGNVALPSLNAMQTSVAKTVQWCRRRYLNKGASGNWFYYDLVPYTDLLLSQLGLQSHLRSGFKSLTEPAWASDLKGLIAEYKTRSLHNLNKGEDQPL